LSGFYYTGAAQNGRAGPADFANPPPAAELFPSPYASVPMQRHATFCNVMQRFQRLDTRPLNVAGHGTFLKSICMDEQDIQDDVFYPVHRC